MLRVLNYGTRSIPYAHYGIRYLHQATSVRPPRGAGLIVPHKPWPKKRLRRGQMFPKEGEHKRDRSNIGVLDHERPHYIALRARAIWRYVCAASAARHNRADRVNHILDRPTSSANPVCEVVHRSVKLSAPSFAASLKSHRRFHHEAAKFNAPSIRLKAAA